MDGLDGLEWSFPNSMIQRFYSMILRDGLMKFQYFIRQPGSLQKSCSPLQDSGTKGTRLVPGHRETEVPLSLLVGGVSHTTQRG